MNFQRHAFPRRACRRGLFHHLLRNTQRPPARLSLQRPQAAPRCVAEHLPLPAPGRAAHRRAPHGVALCLLAPDQPFPARTEKVSAGGRPLSPRNAHRLAAPDHNPRRDLCVCPLRARDLVVEAGSAEGPRDWQGAGRRRKGRNVARAGRGQPKSIRRAVSSPERVGRS